MKSDGGGNDCGKWMVKFSRGFHLGLEGSSPSLFLVAARNIAASLCSINPSLLSSSSFHLHPPASLSSEESSSKPKVRSRKTKLIYLDPTSTYLRPGKKVILDCGMKLIQPVNSKGTVTLTKDAR